MTNTAFRRRRRYTGQLKSSLPLFPPPNLQTDLVEIQNIPCMVCQECGQEQIGQQVQKRIDKLLERAAKGQLKTRVAVM
jgi:hypothetical protein